MGKSKQETRQQQTVTPTNPAFVTRGVMNQQQRIEQLGQRDPREFVAPASQLQNQAFSLAGGLAARMGAPREGLLSSTAMTTQPVGAPQIVPPSNLSFEGAPASWSQGGSTPSLTASPFGAMRPEAAGMRVAADQIGQPDYGEYVRSQPDLQAEYNRIQNGGFGPNLPRSYDANGDGRLQIEEYGRFHDERFGRNEPSRTPPPAIGGPVQGQVTTQPLQSRDPVTGAAIGQVSAAELTSPDPNMMFSGAGLLAADVGMSGANTVSDAALAQTGLLAGVERAQAARLGDAQGYDPALAEAFTLDGAPQGRASLLGDVGSVSAAQIREGDINRLLNPYLDGVVSATEADLQEQFGRQQAALDANAAGAGAFGGSRFGIREAQLDGEQARALASSLGGLRMGAYDSAASLAAQDAARRQEASLASFEAERQAALADQAAQNQFGMANLDSLLTSALANQDAQNRASQINAGLLSDAAAFGANAANEFDRLNQQAEQQVGLANAEAANRFGLAQFDADNQANIFNAGSINDLNRFNAGQADTALARRLQAAGLLGDLGATVGAEDRANIGLLADLGNQQREIDRAFRNAEPTMAQLLGNLNAMQQFGLFRGENSNSTTTTTERGSTLDQIGQAVGIATALGSMGMPGGGGGKAKGIF